MPKEKETVNFLALAVIILCVVFSCFTCFKMTSVQQIRIEDTVVEEKVAVTLAPINIPMMIVFGIIQCLFLCLNAKAYKKPNLLCGIAMLVTILAATAGKIWESTLQSMGGLGYTELKFTLFWYLTLALGVINVIVQIFAWRERNPAY